MPFLASSPQQDGIQITLASPVFGESVKRAVANSATLAPSQCSSARNTTSSLYSVAVLSRLSASALPQVAAVEGKARIWVETLVINDCNVKLCKNAAIAVDHVGSRGQTDGSCCTLSESSQHDMTSTWLRYMGVKLIQTRGPQPFILSTSAVSRRRFYH
jgi:hypothetical protein